MHLILVKCVKVRRALIVVAFRIADKAALAPLRRSLTVQA